MSEPDIREADDTDLVPLVKHLGQPGYFADRLAKQANGEGLLLVAWSDDHPIGDVYLWLAAAEEPEIRDRLPNIPLLTHLEVHHEHRNQGCGSALVIAAERELTGRGRDRVVLAIEQHNDGVAGFYSRRGYREWPFGFVPCLTHPEDGEPRVVEICRIMVKGLS